MPHTRSVSAQFRRSPPNTCFVFGYGALLAPEIVAARCRNAQLVGLARLRDHRFAICAFGTATVLSRPGVDVWGRVWAITAADLARLDVFEGVPDAYRRRLLRVDFADPEWGYAHVYFATADDVGVSIPSYLNLVIAAAIDAGLPPDYVSTLTAIRHPDTWNSVRAEAA
jgi:gamma-glutamylcyclotransferase (GGCT)/AIG2-like uncharacterized protein YtfP